MYGYIYKITNLVTQKIYIGKHKFDKPILDEKYFASGIYINKSLEKYGLDNFSKELIDTADTAEELNEKEKFYIQLNNCIYPNGYNLTSGGDGLQDPPEEVRNKMKPWLGKHQSKESNIKRSNTLKQIKHTEEWVNKIKQSLKGKTPSKETLEGSSKRHKNTKWYNNGIEEHMYFEENVPDGYELGRLKNPFPNPLGKKKSKETIEKISSKKRNSVWYNNGIKEIMITDLNNIPEGFVKGRIKKIQ